jgi:hypothetical protein
LAHGLKLNGLNRLAVEAEEALAQADPGSPVGFGQVVQAESLEFADLESPAGLGQAVQTESLEFADRLRLVALGASRLKEIEKPIRCTCRSLRSGPQLRETDVA